MTDSVKAWWFSEEHKLPHGDGRIIKLGKTHKVKGEIIACANGLHASKKIIDALNYAPGPIIWGVELSGTIVKKEDKLCASERTYISGGVDCSDILAKWARLCALDVIDKWDAPQVAIDFLRTGDEKLRSAAHHAAKSAANYAAWSANYAAKSAAESAANYAAESAAESAARVTQNKRLTKLIKELIS